MVVLFIIFSLILLVILLIIMRIIKMFSDVVTKLTQVEKFVMAAVERKWDDDSEVETNAPHNFKFGVNKNSYKFLYGPRYLLNTNGRENRNDNRV